MKSRPCGVPLGKPTTGTAAGAVAGGRAGRLIARRALERHGVETLRGGAPGSLRDPPAPPQSVGCHLAGCPGTPQAHLSDAAPPCDSRGERVVAYRGPADRVHPGPGHRRGPRWYGAVSLLPV